MTKCKCFDESFWIRKCWSTSFFVGNVSLGSEAPIRNATSRYIIYIQAEDNILAEKFFLQLIRQEWALWTWIELSTSCPTTIPLAICPLSWLSQKAIRTLLLCQLKISSKSTVVFVDMHFPGVQFSLG